MNTISSVNRILAGIGQNPIEPPVSFKPTFGPLPPPDPSEQGLLPLTVKESDTEKVDFTPDELMTVLKQSGDEIIKPLNPAAIQYAKLRAWLQENQKWVIGGTVGVMGLLAISYLLRGRK